jgi:hypothetical protein
MKGSFFEPVRYVMPQKMPSECPLPPGIYDPDLSAQAFRSALELFGKAVLPRIREI